MSQGLTWSEEGENLYLFVDGVKIAKRGQPGTPQAGTWVSVAAGWEAIDEAGGGSILVRFTDPEED